uniref:NADH-ubiquinone oxidoreductase chain 5 n=1 Tax=Tanystylum sp. JZ-2022 TaxID=2992008 RepID=A0A9E7V857_9CHEL|nr:NADH dehydrogenase subunit 5 [Tanystylum sp. JZ-2022]
MFFFNKNLFKLISFILMFMGILVLILGLILLHKDVEIYLEWDLFYLMGSKFSVSFMIDFYSVIFSFFVLYISSSVFLFSNMYMKDENFILRFSVLLLLFVLSMLMLIFSGNMLIVLLGWDGLGLVSYLLVIFYQNKSSLYGGLLTLLTNRLGDATLILSLCLLYSWGSYSLNYMQNYMFDLLIMILLIVSALTKSAQIPFSAWLPAAMAAPTPVSSLVHSSTLVTAGVYLMVRFNSIYMDLNIILLNISLLTMLMAGVSANFEFDLKKIIALSTLSQLSVMFFSLSLGMWKLAYFHMLTHAMFKALMFLCVGSIMHGYFGNQDIRMKGGMVYFSPFISVVMSLSILSLSGMPFLSGYYSKDLILEMFCLGDVNLFMMMVMFLSTLLTLFYSMRSSYFVFVNFMASNSCVSSFEDKDMFSSLMILSLGCLFSGLMLSWIIFPVPIVINLNSLFKLSIMLIFFVGLVLCLALNYFMFSLNSIQIYSMLLTYFLGQMWFLSYLSGQYMMKYPLYFSMYLVKSFDSGVLEFYGGQGLMQNFYGFNFHFSKLSYMNMISYYVFFFIWLFVIFILVLF